MMRFLAVVVCAMCLNACASTPAPQSATLAPAGCCASPQNGTKGCGGDCAQATACCKNAKGCKGAKTVRQTKPSPFVAGAMDHVWPQRW